MTIQNRCNCPEPHELVAGAPAAHSCHDLEYHARACPDCRREIAFVEIFANRIAESEIVKAIGRRRIFECGTTISLASPQLRILPAWMISALRTGVPGTGGPSFIR